MRSCGTASWMMMCIQVALVWFKSALRFERTLSWAQKIMTEKSIERVGDKGL